MTERQEQLGRIIDNAERRADRQQRRRELVEADRRDRNVALAILGAGLGLLWLAACFMG